MKTNYTLEIMRHDITPRAFLSYVRRQAKKHGIDVDINAEYFENGEKVNGEYINTSYTGGTPGTRPAHSETVKALPYDMQTYIRNHDGSVFNEIIEFTFDNEKTGTGYYYIASTDAEPGDAEKLAESTARYHENAIRRNETVIRKNAAEIEDAEHDILMGWRDESYTRGYIQALTVKNNALTMENAEHAAAIAEIRDIKQETSPETSPRDADSTAGHPDVKQAKKARKTPGNGYDIARMISIVNDAINNDASGFHAPRDNSKLRGIPAWNLAPGKTCSPDACAHCLIDGCYAVKNACCHGYDITANNCLRAWTENTALAINHLYTLESMLDTWLSQNRPELFRIHSAGDFFSVEYARMWRRVAMRHPETRFLAFTKQFDFIRHVRFYKLANFELVLSGWTGVHVPEDLRKYYRTAWCNDGHETRIPADAIHCPGDCNKCRACWFLSRMGKDSYFDKH